MSGGERPIAEILGWYRCDVFDCPERVEHWITADDLACQPGEEPSVDDMAQWVQSQGFSLLIDQVKNGYIVMLYGDDDGPFGDCEVVDCWPDPGTDDPPIATIQGGVEMAVRAVAGLREETADGR